MVALLIEKDIVIKAPSGQVSVQLAFVQKLAISSVPNLQKVIFFRLNVLDTFILTILIVII